MIAVYFSPPLLYHPRRSFVRSFARSSAFTYCSSTAATIHPTADTAREEEEEEEEARFFSPASRRHSLLPLSSPNKTLPHSARGEERLAGGSL